MGIDRRLERGKHIGTRIGKLFLIEYRYQSQIASYLCKCDCGNVKWIRCTSLNSGRVKSCGCYANSLISTRTKLPQYGRYGSSVLKAWNGYTRGAYSRGIEWKLTVDEFIAIGNQSCHYCGAPPSVRTQAKYKTNKNGTIGINAPQPYIHSGIDRTNNDRGYTIDNVVPCCTPCNLMKGSMSVTDFIARAIKISDHQSVRQQVVVR